jgi:hypothetical protein
MPETCSVCDENKGDVKYSDENKHCLPTENQYDVDLLAEPFYSQTEPHLIRQENLRHLAFNWKLSRNQN